MSKYLATDLDGTLLKPKLKSKYVCKKNKDTLALFKGNVIIVSGRGEKFVKNICKELAIEETFICCNGACIYLKGKKVFIEFLDTNIINEIINFVKDNFIEYKIILFDENSNLFCISNNNIQVRKDEKEWKKTYPKLAYITNKNAKKINHLLNTKNSIIKMNIVVNDTDKKILHNTLITKKYDLSICICNHSIELTSFKINKGNSLIKLTHMLKLKKENVYVIGDDKNDSSMFNEYTNSFLVKNENNLDMQNKVLHVLDNFADLSKYIKED